MIICVKCKQEKDEKDVHLDKRKKEPYGVCKTCRSIYMKEYYAKNKEKWSVYQKENKELVNERHRNWWKHDPKRYNEKRREYAKIRRIKDPVKINARINLNKAIDKGLIIRPDNCSICLEKGFMEGHHPDYNKPLEVIWLCIKCHKAIHKRMKMR